MADADDHWLKSRHTIAGTAVGVGLTLIVGIVPLARTLYPKSSPWWVASGLVFGAVLLIVGVLLIIIPAIVQRSIVSSTPIAPPVAPPAVAPPVRNPELTIVDQPQGRRMDLIEAEGVLSVAELHLYAEFWVTNGHASEYAQVMRAEMEGIEYDHGDRTLDDEAQCMLWELSEHGVVAPLSIAPRSTIFVAVAARITAPYEKNVWYLPGNAQGHIVLVDQFNQRFKTDNLLWLP